MYEDPMEYTMYEQNISIKSALFLCLNLLCTTNHGAIPLTLHTLYGTFEIDEPVIAELINHPAFQRLRAVRQYGPDYYFRAPLEYNRYDHSIGVFALLRRYKAPLVEQIAGLLHDASHTVFSHVGDWLYGSGDTEHSHQDLTHIQFLEASGLSEVLLKYGYTCEDVHHKKDAFTALEQPLPDLCADRIEYNISGGLLEGVLHPDDVEKILEDLHFDGNHWYFSTIERASQFAHCPLFMTEHVWSSYAGTMRNIICADFLRHALKNSYITHDDIQYGTDDEVWQQLHEMDDAPQFLNALNHPESCYTPCTPEEATVSCARKFRGVDPLIIQKDGSYKRLTELNPAYRSIYEYIKKTFKTKWHLKKAKSEENAAPML